MLVTQTVELDVPSSEDTVLQIRETSSYQRTFYLENLSTSETISIIIQKSSDGSTWTDVFTSFDLGPVGSGTEIATKNVTDSDQLRIRASGGANDKELKLSYCRYYNDTAPHIWFTPIA